AEVAELEAAVVADEDVHRRQVAMEHLAAMEAPEHLQDAGDLASHGPFRPALACPFEERSQVAVFRPLEGEAVEVAAVLKHERKRVVDADRAGASLEDLTEVRLAQPAVDVLARLQRDDAWHVARARDPRREVGLSEAALAE